MAELLLKKGEAVVATARQPDVLNDLKAQYSVKQLLVLKLDVNNKQELAWKRENEEKMIATLKS